MLFLFVSSSIAGAELSVTNQWRIEQASHHCGETENALNYPEYWGDSVTEENRETVCLAEQFAQLAADDGEEWLESQGMAFIEECKTQSKGNGAEYYSCLQTGLKKITRQLSSSCRELGQEDLWEEGRCRRLVSYIFIKRFDQFMKDNRPIVQKLMDNKLLSLFFNPIGAMIFLVLFVLDIVLLTDPGNWVKIPKFGIVVGTIILVSWFLRGELRFIGAILAVLICVGGIAFNHILELTKPKRRKRKKLS